MLIAQPKISIITRQVAGPSGELLIAYFALIETQGVREVRFIGTKAAPAPIAAPEAILALPGAVARLFGESVIRAFESVLSPLSALSFLVSQPARAPNLA